MKEKIHSFVETDGEFHVGRDVRFKKTGEVVRLCFISDDFKKYTIVTPIQFWMRSVNKHLDPPHTISVSRDEIEKI